MFSPLLLSEIYLEPLLAAIAVNTEPAAVNTAEIIVSIRAPLFLNFFLNLSYLYCLLVNIAILTTVNIVESTFNTIAPLFLFLSVCYQSVFNIPPFIR